MRASELEQRIADVSRRQQGNITRQQLLRVGLGPSAITHRCRSGRLHREYNGVYSVGRPARTALERASAAVLACGRQAALSHQSAFTLWGFDKHWRFPVHVSSPTCRTRPGIVSHRVPSLARRDVRTELGITVTTPARTFLDVARTMTRQQLRRAFADARRSAHLKPAALTDILDRNPTHPGHAPLTQALNDYPPAHNGHETDITFPGHDVLIELDSWHYHQHRPEFESDRDHDADQLAEGQPTLRITWERITQTPAKEARRLKRILARFGPG